MHMHENFDDEFLVHQIVTYDYNNADHDNVTCEMEVSPDENNIFKLVHDGSFKHDCKYSPNLTIDGSKGRQAHDLARERLICMKGPLTVVIAAYDFEKKVGQILQYSCISLLLVPILLYWNQVSVSMNVLLYFGAKMATFCIKHIENKKNIFF